MPMGVFKRIGMLTVLAALMLILVLVNVVLSLGNQSLRIGAGERQQIISQSMQLEALNREILTTLVTVAMRTNDEQLKSLLASQGITTPRGTPVPNLFLEPITERRRAKAFADLIHKAHDCRG